MASVMKEFEHLKIDLEELKKATNSFRSKVIGNGGFGKVYEGEVSHSRGRSIATIKRLNREFGQGDPEFLKEIVMLSRYTHRNLIALLGFCDEDGEKILVYEHASNGSLDRHLSSTVLTWTKRLKICLDVARGLAYLHDHKGTQQRVLHRDIKSANILLDDNWNAKLADMGLSKIGPANQEHTVLFTNVVGTPGYCDPQYMVTYALTKESDIYSFGVVLFEVLCGRLCSKWTNNHLEILVPMWKQSYKHKKLDEIIFKGLMSTMDPNSLRTFSDIAFQCLHDSREQRPTISLLVKKLEIALKCQERHEMKLDDVILGKKTKEGAIQNNESDDYDDNVDEFLRPGLAHASFSPSPEQDNEENVVNSRHSPSILEEKQDPDDSEQDANEGDAFDDVDIKKPLPRIEDLQINGDPFPGSTIQASGYSMNGTAFCHFKWVRHFQDGSAKYIEGAHSPAYTVTADDLDNYLEVQVQPLDDSGRKGTLVKCFANGNKKITCYPDMLHENVVNSHHLPYILEEKQDLDDSKQDDNESDDFIYVDIRNTLPTVEDLQIVGDPFPGNTIQASERSRRTTRCQFEWVRHFQDGSAEYIEGAHYPAYTVTADDLDNYLEVQVQPFDDSERKGTTVNCFANGNKKITWHPDMLREIVNSLSLGHASFKVSVLNWTRNTWEPGILEVKKSGYSIINGPNNGVVVVDHKYAPTTVIILASEDRLRFYIVGPEGVEQYLCANSNATNIRCSRDAIVLTMRLFIKRLIQDHLQESIKKTWAEGEKNIQALSKTGFFCWA